MPDLFAAEDNSTLNLKTGFSLNLLNKFTLSPDSRQFELIAENMAGTDTPEELWQFYEVILHRENSSVSFKSDTNETNKTQGIFAFNLSPINELLRLQQGILNFLISEKRQQFIFQPADPSFELVIQRSHFDQFKVYLWLDEGNTRQLEYTWNASGIRFISSQQQIRDFIQDLI
jgi:hypothetical protein